MNLIPLSNPIYFNRVFAANFQQKLELDRARVIRAQVFAEFHEQVRLREEKLREKDEKLGEKDARIAVMEQEIKDLRLKLDQKGANVKAAVAPRRSLFVGVQGGEKQKLADVLAGKDGDKVLDTFILGSSAQIFVMNLVCVRKGEWLNSETINVYVLMIEDAARRAGHNVTSFNSYFVSKIETEVTCDV